MIERLFRNETVTFDKKKSCSHIRQKNLLTVTIKDYF